MHYEYLAKSDSFSSLPVSGLSSCPEWLHNIVVKTGEAGYKHDKAKADGEGSLLKSFVCKKIVNVKVFNINNGKYRR